MLRGKDVEVEKLVLQRTSELEQRHKEALNAQAQVHAGKVEELEAKRDGLKEQALKLSQEKDTLNSALTEAEGVVVSKAGELSEANNSIKDLKLKLEGLEKMLSEARAREGTLTKNLETEKQLRKNEALNFKEHVEGENRWLDRLATVANQAAAQLAIMGRPDVRYVPERSVRANCSLTMFFEKVVGTLERLHANRAASLADESRRLCQGA